MIADSYIIQNCYLVSQNPAKMSDKKFSMLGISTFTHFGRHAQTINKVIRLLNENSKKIICLGSGFIEPFLFVEQLLSAFPDSIVCIDAIEQETIFVDSIKLLLSGEKIKVSDFASLAYDTNCYGQSIINQNFVHCFDLGVREWSEFGLDPYNLISQDHNYFVYTGKGNHLINPICSDVKKYLEDKQLDYHASVDLVYAGSLFINLLKIHPIEYLEEILESVYKILNKSGILGVCTSPVIIHENQDELYCLLNSNFNFSSIFAENIIVEKNGVISGDYAITLNKKDEITESSFYRYKSEIEELFKGMASNSFMKSLDYKICIIHQDDLCIKLLEPNELLIGALQLLDNSYMVCLVNRQAIVNNNFFKERRTLLQIARK
jgi:hypothetical protein